MLTHVLDTNNGFTSFYHPLFQLLLPAMSPDAYCKLYFDVYGERGVQSIPTYAHWEIDDLQTGIMNLAGLGTDVVLRKVRIAFWPPQIFFSPIFTATRSH